MALKLNSQMGKPKGLIIELRRSNELPVVIATAFNLDLFNYWPSNSPQLKRTATNDSSNLRINTA